MIIFDTPSVSRSSCSTTLGNIADGVILVLRAGYASTSRTTGLLRNWDGTGIQLFGFVFNDLNIRNHNIILKEKELSGTAA